ncbi:oligopeptide/dipeptide ABC transporter ATPase [Natrinema pellirubrum DSM 15624]|uniref:Nickel import system ATP-binding protein NikD n=1 Tax=Natrinema pellirubrum (strain DSM 15624 / CIP 106293 / JCM 10476 / NCIMB 786 / 157) TaxID=797303 RepID=L0JIT6_NATP1|nr:ABC transporter ATP-binding protein [Natrinema pellirubrum]AGB30753.1 oligopeptide/dipeptide ABC transporter, ATP-binding protein [Natrinema pellirubrum DSM 15624]ELY80859.1 oligopeptide/dipeptide ABC transporter ATPase [Natrinema pellirubrum DSM 15624]
MTEEILRVSDLSTRYFTQEGQVNAVSSLDLGIERGEVFGIVGESGSGKSVTARSVMNLIDPPGEITDGEIRYRNPDLVEAIADDHPDAIDGEFVKLLELPDDVRRSLRGTSFSMIFQDPESSFNPTLTVGEQLAEAVEVQRRASANPRSTRARTESAEYSLGSLLLSKVLPSRRYVSEESRDRAIELLELVGIPDPVERADEYPHEYSGGMLQRAMIAQALAGEPDVLIADEPTTALDVTIQAQILDLLDELQAETEMTILLITHNLGVIARMCDRVGVMYAGEIVERGTLADVFDEQVHPYTAGLLGSVPDLEGDAARRDAESRAAESRDDAAGRLQPIPGNVPSLLDHEMGDRCHFADRCPKAMTACLEHPPEYPAGGSDDHRARCVLAETEYDEGAALSDGYFDERERSAGDEHAGPEEPETEPPEERSRQPAETTGGEHQ